MTPTLSIVAVSRNDDHGRDLLRRMQDFVDVLSHQCARHRLDAELLLVEWNPPPDRPGLADAIDWSATSPRLPVRIVTVPPAIHARHRYADRLPLFQMIGKNAGIRRARGRFVLATNVDILFDDATVDFLRRRLRDGIVLRADRFDVREPLPDGAVESRLEFCSRNVSHVFGRAGIFDVRLGKMSLSLPLPDRRGETPKEDLGDWWGLVYADLVRTRAKRCRAWPAYRTLVATRGTTWAAGLAGYASMVRELHWSTRYAHIFACGDFTLLAARDWRRLRGYPEYQGYSWNLDSVLLYAALADGLEPVSLSPACRIYHLHHAAGSGWTPDDDEALFNRLRREGIPFVSDDELELWRRRIYRDPRERVLNPESWGLGEVELPETAVRGST